MTINAETIYTLSCLGHISMLNIQSSFTVQNSRAQLVKIEHVILLYLTSANSDSASLTITQKKSCIIDNGFS